METVGAKALEDFADNIKVLSLSPGPPAALGAVGRTARDLSQELLQRAGHQEGLLVSCQYPLASLSFPGAAEPPGGDAPAPFSCSVSLACVPEGPDPRLPGGGTKSRFWKRGCSFHRMIRTRNTTCPRMALCMSSQAT